MSRVLRRPSVRRELVEVFGHYATESGLGVARRFLAQAEATFLLLASRPGLGTSYLPAAPLWADVRYFPIARFKNYLVFSRPLDDGIEVLHVLHGARDLDALLREEFGLGDDDEDAEGG